MKNINKLLVCKNLLLSKKLFSNPTKIENKLTLTTKNNLFYFLIACGLLIANTSKAQSYNLHWGSTAFGTKTFSKNITNIAGSGIDALVTINNSSDSGNISATAFTADNNAFQYSTPKVGAANVAWLLPGTTGANPLVEYVDWKTHNDSVVTTITFSRPINNVSFYLGDMDRTSGPTYVDKVTFIGSLNGVAVANPIVTKFQATKSGLDTVIISGNTAYGNASGAAAGTAGNGLNASTGSLVTQGATILVQYSNQITELKFIWRSNGPGFAGTNPANEAFVIGDIAFSKPIQSYPFPPTADNFINKPMLQGNGATAIPALTATDLDGKIDTFRITSLPPASQGVLSVPCPFTPTGATCTGGFADLTAAVLAANPSGIPLTPAQAEAIRFDPAPNFNGTAQFTFNATDNAGNISNTATYQLPINTLPPVSNNIMENSMANSNGPTAIQGLNSSDIDGTISSYQITFLPPTTEGVLSIPCPATLTNATCVGGFQNLTAAILAGYPFGMPLTAVQMAGMRFDPAAGFIGNAKFNYNALDNSGNVSNTANYTIPVAAFATPARPPLADNIAAQPINNSLGATTIPSLKANDLDGSVTGYTISTIPSAASGILSCCGGTPVTAGQKLTPAQIATLQFDPAPNFVGTASFTYSATDNAGLESNVASYDLQIVNTPPLAANINALVAFNAAPTKIPALSGSDADGTVTKYTITTIPTIAQGTISIPCPVTPAGATCTGGFADLTAAVLAANPSGIDLTPAQAAAIRFAPGTGFSGVVPFTYATTDNNNNKSAPANYNIVVPVQPPVTNDITNTVMANTLGATAVNVLSGTDPDGTIASYTMFSVPPASQGILSVPCGTAANPTITGATCTSGFQNLTEAVFTNAANINGIVLSPSQAAGLRFDPTANYFGLAAFKYGATDNSGLLSNVSTYTLQVSATTGNIPPVAKNILTPSMANTNGPLSIPTLFATDDTLVASFTLSSVPAATQGILSIPCPVTPTGATCTGNFAELTPAVLALNPNGIVLTPLQAAGMRFDPAADFAGKVDFSYYATDNNGATSAGVIYTIPVTSLPPMSNSIIAPAMAQTNGPTVIPAFSAADADGTIASYQIESLPAASQGVLSIPCPATPIGATCTGGFADLTAAVLANYPVSGITLTPAQMAGLRFDPAPGYDGNVIFNYHATDNSGAISNSSSYTIPVNGLPPVSTNILAAKMLNTNGATAIPALSSADVDGSISTFVITSVPPASQGVLSIPCPATPIGGTCIGGFTDLTEAVLAANPGGIVLTPTQAASLRFDPAVGSNTNVTFNYAAYDNSGNLSNVAAYTIPTGNSSILPLTLVNFDALRSNNDIKVYWKTESEVNVNKFEIEYSLDSRDFTKAGTIQAQNAAANNYQFTLVNHTKAIYYLRLKMIDNDGRFTYSNIVIVKMNNITSKINIYPNPVTEYVNIDLGNNAKGDYTLLLVDGAGKTVKAANVKNAQSNQLVTIQRGNLASGIYFLKIVSNHFNESTVNKLIIR